MLPLSIKDDEYKPPKFNLLGKISGWFRCGVLWLLGGGCLAGGDKSRELRMVRGPGWERHPPTPPPAVVEGAYVDWVGFGRGTRLLGPRHPLGSCLLLITCIVRRSILSDKTSRNLFFFLCLNLSFAFVELLYGIWSNW